MTIAAAITALSSVLGDRLVRSKSELDQHGQSESHFDLTPPDAVAYPVSTREVAEIVRICAAQGCPVTGWGAGTSLEGHGLAVRGGVVVDFAKMSQILELNADDMDIRVQPGMTREALNEELRATGLFFPVDPGANASIGGMVSTRASGTTSVRYGTMRDNVMGLEVVLADGRVIRTGSRARKSSAGYDLTRLFVGAEGTLGLITEVTLRLYGQPAAISSAVCAFPSVDDAVATVIEAIQIGVPVARMELVDAATARAVNAYARADFPELPHLLLEFHGSDAAVAEQAETVGEIAASHGGADFRWARLAEERSRLWKMRHDAYRAILASKPGARAIVTDVCVPISRLAEAIRDTRADIDASPITAPILGHVGDGNFHAILLVDMDNSGEVTAAEALAERLAARALALGGTITGEHGIGFGKLGQMEAEHGEAWDVMGQIKRALDPENIMNPGKVLRQN